MFFWYLVVWLTGATVRTHRDAARVAPARSLGVLLRIARDRNAGTDDSGKGTDNPGKGTDNPGKGTDNPGKGTDNPGKGTDNPGKGTDGRTIGTSVPQRTVPITNV